MQKKIKIIFVTAALEVGGAEKFLLDLLSRLDRGRFEPILATVVGSGKLEPNFRALNLPIYIHGRRRIKYLGGLVQFWQLYKLFKKECPDIVHTQLFAPDLWGRLAARTAGVKVIITTEQNINVDQSALREWLKKLTYKLTTRAAAISLAVKNYMIAKYDVPAETIEIIPNDVDFETLEKRMAEARVFEEAGDKKREADGAEAKTTKIILTVGRLVLQKGQKYLIEAFSKLRDKENLELWIIGEGPLEKELKGLVKKYLIEEQVKFLGVRFDVPELLVRADLFVFPSLWEGLGIAVLEAAAARLPIIASKIDGILDIIEDDKSGILTPPRDVGALTEAMKELLNNPCKAREFGDAAYKHVKENFDIKIVTKKYEMMFEKILEKN